MSNCNDIILSIYLDKKINSLIRKIKPVDLQDDLKQEMIISLYNAGCDKLILLNNEGNLLSYTLKMIWNMGTSSTSQFYTKYKKKEIEKALKYLQYLSGNKIFNHEHALIANKLLDDKINKSPNDAHESIIFNKYIELKSAVKVAQYFKVPKSHVFKVINNCKKELKQVIKK
jgi:hypothetical protein